MPSLVEIVQVVLEKIFFISLFPDWRLRLRDHETVETLRPNLDFNIRVVLIKTANLYGSSNKLSKS